MVSIFPVLTVTHAATHLMHRYQQKVESLQQLNFEFNEHIQAITNYELQDTTDPLRLFNLSISAMTIRHIYPTWQKAIDYA